MNAGEVVDRVPTEWDAEVEVVVIGAGACGLTAALRANEAGRDVILLERDSTPSGSTAMLSGFVPAPATRFQKAAGIDDDTPERFYTDIMAKSHGSSDPDLARLASETIGPALEWLADVCGFRLEWIVLDDFLYPGHSHHRMHAVPEKTGASLSARLLSAVEAVGLTIVTEARAKRLYMKDARNVSAVEIERPDGVAEIIRCDALILACNSFGGNPALVRRHIPDIAGGPYYGYAGNTGDAVLWGQALVV